MDTLLVGQVALLLAQAGGRKCQRTLGWQTGSAPAPEPSQGSVLLLHHCHHIGTLFATYYVHGKLFFNLFRKVLLMSLLTFIITLAVVGLILWLVTSYIPMAPVIKRILVVGVVIIVAFWLLNAFGILGNINAVHIGHLQ